MGKRGGHIGSGLSAAVFVLAVVYVVLAVSPPRSRHGSLDKLLFPPSIKESRSRVWTGGCAGGDTGAAMATLVHAPRCRQPVYAHLTFLAQRRCLTSAMPELSQLVGVSLRRDPRIGNCVTLDVTNLAAKQAAMIYLSLCLD